MPTLTLQALSQRVLDRLDNNQALFSQREITNAINEAYRVLNLLTAYQQVAIPVPGFSQPNRVWYTVPPGIAIPTRVSWEGRYLSPTTLNTLGRSNAHWIEENSGNTWIQPRVWIKVGLKTFGIWPADSLGGGQLIVSGVASITPLVNPTDTVNWNAAFLTAFDLYATHVLQLKESPQIFQQGSRDYQELLRVMKRIGAWRQFVQPKYWIEAAQTQDR